MYNLYKTDSNFRYLLHSITPRCFGPFLFFLLAIPFLLNPFSSFLSSFYQSVCRGNVFPLIPCPPHSRTFPPLNIENTPSIYFSLICMVSIVSGRECAGMSGNRNGNGDGIFFIPFPPATLFFIPKIQKFFLFKTKENFENAWKF